MIFPYSIPDAVTAWYEGDLGAYHVANTTLATNGQTVLQWQDQSENGYHLAGATAPAWTQTNAIFNNHGTIGLTDNTAQALTNASVPTSNSRSLFVVLRKKTAPSGERGAVFLSAATPVNPFAVETASTISATNWEIYSDNGGTRVSVGAVTTGVPQLIEIVGTNTLVTLYLNGASIGTFQPRTDFTDGSINIGFLSGWFNAGDYEIGEILLFNSVVSATGRVILEASLATKYGFTNSGAFTGLPTHITPVYVDTGGSILNPGTTGSPWDLGAVTYAAQQGWFLAGDSILLHPQTFTGQLVFPNGHPGVTVDSSSGTATIDNSGLTGAAAAISCIDITNPASTVSHPFVVGPGLILKSVVPTANNSYAPGTTTLMPSGVVMVRDTRTTPVARLGYMKITPAEISGGYASVDVSALNSGAGSGNNSGFNNVRVAGYFHEATMAGLYMHETTAPNDFGSQHFKHFSGIDTSGLRVDSITGDNSPGVGSGLGFGNNVAGAASASGNGIIVSCNDNAVSLVTIGSKGYSWLCSGVYVSNCGASATQSSGPGGIYCENTTNALIEYCVVAHIRKSSANADGEGINPGEAGTDIVMRNNVVYDTDGVGVGSNGHLASAVLTMEFNILVDTAGIGTSGAATGGTEITAGSGGNCTVAYNTLTVSDPATKSSGGISTYGTGCYTVNNIVSMGVAIGQSGITFDSSVGSQVIQGNLYFGGTRIAHDGNGAVNYSYAQSATWQGLGFDTTGVFSTDPALASLAIPVNLFKYHPDAAALLLSIQPKTGSPVIGAGITAAAATVLGANVVGNDFSGLPASNTIGAISAVLSYPITDFSQTLTGDSVKQQTTFSATSVSAGSSPTLIGVAAIISQDPRSLTVEVTNSHASANVFVSFTYQVVSGGTEYPAAFKAIVNANPITVVDGKAVFNVEFPRGIYAVKMYARHDGSTAGNVSGQGAFSAL